MEWSGVGVWTALTATMRCDGIGYVWMDEARRGRGCIRDGEIKRKQNKPTLNKIR